MSTRELEELVATLRQFIQKARSCNDTFEYCRLSEEVRFAEAALADSAIRPITLFKPKLPPLALA